MTDAKALLASFAEQIEKTIIEFSINEEHAIELLEKVKDSLGEKHTVTKEEKELFDACVYNALATINTVPGQKKKNTQLLMALAEAKDEIKTIMEFM